MLRFFRDMQNKSKKKLGFLRSVILDGRDDKNLNKKRCISVQSKATGDALPGVVTSHRFARLGQLQEQAAGLPVRHVRQEFLVFRLYRTGQGQDRG